jgi:hypothetical protein
VKKLKFHFFITHFSPRDMDLLHEDLLMSPKFIYASINAIRITYYVGVNKHRDDDKPALISKWKILEWYRHGGLHRDNAPARIVVGHSWVWFQDGKEHRSHPLGVNKPAFVSSDALAWYENGQLHREGEPALIEYDNNIAVHIEWWIHGYQQRSISKDSEDGCWIDDD